MRRRLNWLVLAVTTLVVIAFVLPLGLLVRRQAAEAAQVAAEQRVQSATAALVVAVAASDGALDATVAESALVTDVAIVLPDGTRVGDTSPPADIVPTVLAGTPTAIDEPDGSWAVGIPVATPEGNVAVVAVASAEEIGAGVGRAVTLLTLLGLTLVGGSLLLADRLGRSLVGPARRTATAARRLSEGDLTVRAPLDGPPEIRSVASALNGLADRLTDIIENERRSLADLSHRLRTPLTALRLEAEKFGSNPDENHLLIQVDRTQRAVDELIREVGERGRGPRQDVTSDLVEVVCGRLAFWDVLAREQDRRIEIDVIDQRVPIRSSPADISAVVDALVGNVFAHTPAATNLKVTIRTEDGRPLLSVCDDGPGFPAQPVVNRGESGAGSTGLGLDIAASFAERLGGGLETGEGPAGGALVTLRLG